MVPARMLPKKPASVALPKVPSRVASPPSGRPAAAAAASNGLELYAGEEERGLYIVVWGGPGTGKTRQLLTALETGPAAIFDLDLGLHRAYQPTVDSLASPHELSLWRRKGDRDLVKRSQSDCTADRERFLNAYRDTILSRSVDSVLIDTETELWELYRFADFGKLSHVQPRYYENVNALMQQTLRAPMPAAMNLIVAQRAKDEYVGDKSTGNMVGAGWKGTHYEADVVLELFRMPTPTNEAPNPFNEFGARVQKFGLRFDLVGQVLWGADLCFKRIRDIYNGAALNPEG